MCDPPPKTIGDAVLIGDPDAVKRSVTQKVSRDNNFGLVPFKNHFSTNQINIKYFSVYKIV